MHAYGDMYAHTLGSQDTTKFRGLPGLQSLGKKEQRNE